MLSKPGLPDSGVICLFFQRIVILTLLLPATSAAQERLVTLNGYAQGTTYQVKYYDEAGRNFKKPIEDLLREFDKALSLYDENSELSQFNRSHSVRFRSPYFLPVLQKSGEIFRATGGLFDPTVMPLVEAYGFGPGGKRGQTEAFDLDSVRGLVGFDKIAFDSIAVRKSEENTKLDFNAIAQGYSVDLVCDLLRSEGVANYLVEIGGELRGGGAKPAGTPWVVGIANPSKPTELLGTVRIENRGMATSGNYRNHYARGGVTYTHIINPLDGLPGSSDILSVTVLAPDAATADGYATAFLIMGIATLRERLPQYPDLDVWVVYSGETGEMESYISPGLVPYVSQRER